MLTFAVLFCYTGTGFCMSFYAFVSAIPKYFPDDTNNVFGFINALGTIGMMILPPVVQFLIQLYGWQGAMMLLGAFNANCIVCSLLIRPRNQTEQVAYTKLRNDSITEKQTRFQTLIEFLRFVFLKRPKFIIILIADLLAGMIFSGWVIFLVQHATSKGVSDQLAAFLSSSGALGVIVGRLMVGPIIQSGRLTAIQLYIVLAIVDAVVFFLDIVSNDFTLLAINAFFNGLATGTISILNFGASAEILGEDLAVEGYSISSMIYPIGDVLGGVALGKL